MKLLFSLFSLAILFSCTNNTSSNQAKGKLYIESSVFGGLKISWLWLGEEGVFVRNPRNGADPVNYALEKTNNADQIGQYTVNGNTITATYENGKTETWELEYDGKRLNTIAGLFVGEAEAMPADYKIAGSYAANTFYSSVASVSTFVFSKDGNFVLEGQGFVTTEDAAGNAKAATGGTYTISGNTLHLHFNNGESSVSLIGVFKTGTSAFLVINDKLFSQAN